MNNKKTIIRTKRVKPVPTHGAEDELGRGDEEVDLDVDNDLRIYRDSGYGNDDDDYDYERPLGDDEKGYLGRDDNDDDIYDGSKAIAKRRALPPQHSAAQGHVVRCIRPPSGKGGRGGPS